MGKTGICSGCGKDGASMGCPTCSKMGLEDNWFCGQDCFKANWDKHKKMHKKARHATDDTVMKAFDNYKFTGPLRPAPRKRQRLAPKDIPAPDYADDGEPTEEIRTRKVVLPTPVDPKEWDTFREAARIARQTLDIAGRLSRIPGTTGEDVDDACHEFIVKNGAYPSPLNYYNFPKSLCVSVNEVVCHGIPDQRPFEEGDIVNVDVTIYYKGFHADLNETYYCGDISKIDPDTKRLVQGTYDCFMEAIKICKPGVKYSEIGNVIEKHAKTLNLTVNRSYCGHGVGKLFHTAPTVPHYAGNKAAGTMKVGHVFTIEPMICLGTPEDVTWPDDWTAVTVDGKKTAQFEHSIMVTETGVEILTRRHGEDSPEFQWEHDHEKYPVDAGIPKK